MNKQIEQILHERKHGIILSSPNGGLIYSGKKELILKHQLYKNHINKILYIIDGTLCYGLIRLKFPDKIGPDQFVELSSKHHITEDDRRKWWPHKEVLYAYGFDIVRLFEKPREISIESHNSRFVQEFEFISDNKLQFKTLSKKHEIQSEMVELFVPTKITNRFTDPEKAVSYMFSKSGKYALEKRYIGTRVILFKFGNEAKLYSSSKQELSSNFIDIISEAKEICNLDYIIDGIISGEKSKLYALDIISLGSQDLSSEPWYVRKSKLHSLRYCNHIKEAHSIIIDNPSNAIKAIRFLNNLPDSGGVIIREYRGTYIMDGNSCDLIVVKNDATITTSPGISDIAGKKWKKEKIPGPKKYEDMTDQERIEYEEAVASLKAEEENSNTKTKN